MFRFNVSLVFYALAFLMIPMAQVCVSQESKKEAPKPAFSFDNLNMTSNYLALWRQVFIAEQAKAQRNGNDVGLTELQKKFDDRIQDFIGKEFVWVMRFDGISNYTIQLDKIYRYKTSGVRVEVDRFQHEEDMQKPEAWMGQLKRGDLVRVTGTIKDVVIGSDGPIIVVRKVAITR